MNTGSRARHEGVFKVGLACAYLKGEREKRSSGNGHVVRKKVAVGKLCLRKKKGSLLGMQGKGEMTCTDTDLLHLIFLYIVHMHYETF